MILARNKVHARKWEAKFAKEVWMESVDGRDRRPTLCVLTNGRTAHATIDSIVLLARNECSVGMIVWPQKIPCEANAY